MKDVYPRLGTLPNEWLTAPAAQPDYLELPGVVLDEGTDLGSAPLANGSASLSGALLLSPGHTILATYSGSATFATSAAGFVAGPSATATTLTSTTAGTGQAVTFTALVTPVSGSGTPTGTVQP